MTAQCVEKEIWYMHEFSRKGADDWFLVSTATWDTLEGAQKALETHRATYKSANRLNDYRIVRKTAVTEVIE